MNKTVLGILLGLVLGAGGTWLALRNHEATGAAPAAAEASKSDEKPKDNPLHLPPAKRTAVGIVLAKPAAATLAPEVPAFGRVIDPTPFVSLVAEQATARAALAASEKELARVKKLFDAGGNASAQAVETAEANAARDRAAVDSAHVRLLAGWGRKLAADTSLERLRVMLEKGGALVRLDVLPGDKPADEPKTARVNVAGNDQTVDAEILGPAPVADPQVQGASFLALVPDHSFAAGAALRATLPGVGEPAAALIVPRSAVVYHQGSAWVYVLGEEDTFERKLVTIGRATADGIAVTSGLEADEQVVTTGAQQLLAAELQAGGAPDEG
jgi:hypothetical protein